MSLSPKSFHVSKENMSYAKKNKKHMPKSMRKKKIHAKKHEKMKKERNKDNPYFQKPMQKRVSCTKEYKKLEIFKISHTCTFLIKCMTCISLDPVFGLAKLCDASMSLFHTYTKLHKKHLEVGQKEGKMSKAFGEDYAH
jgi:hypothetical protein